MRFSKTIAFDSTPDLVFKMLSDPAFRQEVCVAAGAESYDVSVTSTDSTLESVIETASPVDGMPGLVKKFLGSSLTLLQVERWTSQEGGTMEVSLPGTPGSFRGTISLRPSGTGSAQTVEAEIKVGVPLVGGKIEALIGSGLGHVLKVQARVGADWLTR
jgi:hypothetical protein